MQWYERNNSFFCGDGQIIVAPDVEADEAAQAVIDQLKRLWGNLAAENERLKLINQRLEHEVQLLNSIAFVMKDLNN